MFWNPVRRWNGLTELSPGDLCDSQVLFRFWDLSLVVVLAALVIFNFLLFTMGLKKFYGKAVS